MYKAHKYRSLLIMRTINNRLLLEQQWYCSTLNPLRLPVLCLVSPRDLSYLVSYYFPDFRTYVREPEGRRPRATVGISRLPD